MNALIEEEMRMNLIRRIAISLDPNVHFIFSSYIYFSCHFTFLHFIAFFTFMPFTFPCYLSLQYDSSNYDNQLTIDCLIR